MTIRTSQRLGALPGYPLAEIPSIKRRLIASGMDVIDLGAGDNDTPPPAPVIEALRDALGDPALSKYGFQQGLPAFRQAASRYMERRFGQRFDPAADLLPLIGSKEGLAHLPYAFVDPGDVVIFPEPGYQAYVGGAILSLGEKYVYPLRADEGFLLELDRVPVEILQRTKLVYANYPNNPTAAVAPREYLERLVATCRKHDIVLAYDNAYCDVTFDDYVAPSIFEIPGARDVAVEFFSLSKSFSMTGWRLGWAAGRAELITALTKVKNYVDTGPFLAVQQAGALALDRSEEFVAPVTRILQRRRDAGVRALEAAGFTVAVPKAAMYLWVPLPASVPSGPFARRVLEEQGVVVLPGSAFGPAGEGYFRIALTVEPERLEHATARLGRTLEAWRGSGVTATA
jgi:LL-diaminopimelate aminotransferase